MATARSTALERFPFTVESIDRPAPDLALLRLRQEGGAPYRFQAGQWCYHFRPQEGPDAKRPYSIASAPSDAGVLDFAIKVVNPTGVSEWVFERRPGDTVEVSRALGTFTFKSPPRRTAVFLATGTGVAPFRSMIRELWSQGDDRDLWLFMGSGHKETLPFHDEFEREAAMRPRFHYIPTLSRAATFEWTGRRGWIQEHFLHEFRGRTDFDAYICGVRRMVDDVKALLKDHGLPESQVHTERYD